MKATCHAVDPQGEGGTFPDLFTCFPVAFHHLFTIAAKFGWICGHAAAFSTVLTSFSGKSGVAMSGLSSLGILSGDS